MTTNGATTAISQNENRAEPRLVYQDDWITLWCGDCRDIIPSLPSSEIGLVLADPPYGTGELVNRGDRGRSKMAQSYNFDQMEGDREPFDPRHLFKFRRLILFGANHYADKLPSSPSWIVWDKLNGLTTTKRPIGISDNADLELAWTNLGGPARLFIHRWLGLLKDSENRERRVHPTQKPVALMSAILDVFTKPGDLILDPYMGSGPVILAARRMKRRAIGIDIIPEYCRLTLERYQAEFPVRRATRA